MRLRGVVLAGLVVVLLGSLCGSASAAFKYSLTGDLEVAGGFGGLGGNSVAVDDGNGRTYVADSGSGAVDVFETSSRAQLASLDGSLTPAGSFGGSQVEVAANNATGDVYVLDSTNNVVDVFDPAGGYVCQITGSATPSASECNGAAGSDTPAHGFNTPKGIAVDQATGEVFVVDAFNEAVDVFSVGGAYLRQIVLTLVPIGINSLYMDDIAVDDFNGRVYLGNNFTAGVYEFDALSGAYIASWDGNNTPARSFGGAHISVAAHNASGDVYVTDTQHEVTDVFGPGGEYLTQITESATGKYGGKGTAVDQANAGVYVSDNEAKRVSVFGALLIPDVTTASASSVLPTSATLNGVVNPDGIPLTECAFEYVSDAVLREDAGGSYEELLKQGFTAEEIFGALGVRGACEHPDAAEISGSSSVAVHAALAGLLEGVTYHYRLVAENANGANQGAVVEVTPPAPPSIDSASAENMVSGAADLRVSLNPHAGQTSYRFEYGISTAYGTSIPAPDGVLQAGLGAKTIIEHLTGLQANTTYHWRVIAQNIAGTTTSVDHTFIYDTNGEGLSDNRAYEMVTPPQKNGALVGINLGNDTPQVAEDGSRLVALSVQCFAAARGCSAYRSFGSFVAFSRTSGGWMPSVLAPPASMVEESSNIYASANTGATLFGGPMAPAGEDGFFGREPDGSLVEIGPEYPPSFGQAGEDAGVEGTDDLSHVIYTSDKKWPFDATASGVNAPSLYEYEGVGNQAPVLVGVSGGRGSTDLISVCGTQIAVGPSHAQRYNSLSANGRVVFFSPLSPCSSGSGANAGVPVSVPELYARLDESRTVLVSGRSPLGCTGTCLSSVPREAAFQGASSDGSKVFFSSSQQLTDNASDGQGNLYEYDFNRPAGDNLIALSAGDTSGGGPGYGGMEAISPDGSHVYFVASGVLADSANSQGQLPQAGANNLYVYERDAAYPQGRVGFITALPEADREFELEWLDQYPGFSSGLGLANVTPDGRFLVFLSHGQLTADDHHNTAHTQAFRYDAQTGELIRLSVGERGFNDDGNAGIGDARIVPSYVAFPRSDPTMSHDGSYVFFESPVALTPGAVNDVRVGTFGTLPVYATNVYEWHEGHISLISDGKDTTSIENAGANAHGEALSAVELLGSDGSGANVFFATSDSLVPQDTDTERDYYDARICSASSPCVSSPETVVGCSGEACRGVPSGAPGLPAALSSAFSGAGNPAVVAPVKAKQKAKPKRRKTKHKQRRKRRSRSVGKRGKAKGSSRSTRRSK